MKLKISILFIVFFWMTAFSQPYVITKEYNFDSSKTMSTDEISFSEAQSVNIVRINLTNSNKDILFNNLDSNIEIYTNMDNSIFLIVKHNSWEVYSMEDVSLLHTTIKYFDCINGNIILSANWNSLWGFTCAETTGIQLYKLDLNSNRTDSLLLVPDSDYTTEEVIISKNLNNIYFFIEDTSFIPYRDDKGKILNYSLVDGSIVYEKELASLGYMNADAYILYKGYKGKGIIQSSFRNQNKDEYFRVYDFDSNTGSNFIHHKGYVNPYIISEGEKLVLAETDNMENAEYLTGKIYIYDVLTTNLMKTISLPSNGKVYTIENYPDKLYYLFGKEDSVITLDIDSLTQPLNPNLLVKLTNSQGASLTTGTLQYYEGSWKNAAGNGDGTFTVTTNLNAVSLRMTYEYGSQTVSNITAHNNTYTFQTVSAQVQLQNSSGSPIDTGRVQYYAGAWWDFGITSNGVTSKELLPGTYSFRMTYAGGSNDKQQNIGTNATIVFQTVNAFVELRNSANTLIDQGTVQYYAGSWRDIGVTSNGAIAKELLPNNYSFRMTYAGGSNDKQQNIGTNPVVVFQTVNAVVELRNSANALIDQGTVQYYAGSWRSFGTTSNGAVSKELLPNNYSFRMSYEFVSNDKQQNIGPNSTVIFSTVLCTVRVKNSQNQLLNNAAVKYYPAAAGWRTIGNTINGEITKELLPANIPFRANYGTAQQDKTVNLSTTNLVEFIFP